MAKFDFAVFPLLSVSMTVPRMPRAAEDRDHRPDLLVDDTGSGNALVGPEN
jgi:hypothetical protein